MFYACQCTQYSYLLVGFINKRGKQTIEDDEEDADKEYVEGDAEEEAAGDAEQEAAGGANENDEDNNHICIFFVINMKNQISINVSFIKQLITIMYSYASFFLVLAHKNAHKIQRESALLNHG